MRLLFDLGHPAHVHLFRNLIRRIEENGGITLSASRPKDVTVALCNHLGITHRVLSKPGTTGTWSAARELVIRTANLFRLARSFDPDALFGTSASIGTVGRILRIPSFVFNEDDASIVPLFAKTAYPLAHYVVTPTCLKHENHGRKHLTYSGYHELAYLHPNHFTPNPKIPRSIGLDEKKPYFVLRFVALKAHHDASAEGLSRKAIAELVKRLTVVGPVVITTEGALSPEFREFQYRLPPENLHDLLAFASLYVGDSQTVAAEAAVLGVPSIRCNSFVGKISYLKELEDRYRLTRGFLPWELDQLYTTVDTWLQNLGDVRRRTYQRRQKMLSECVDVSEWQWNLLYNTLQQ